jgi:hypothetical protein
VGYFLCRRRDNNEQVNVNEAMQVAYHNARGMYPTARRRGGRLDVGRGQRRKLSGSCDWRGLEAREIHTRFMFSAALCSEYSKSKKIEI